MISARNYRQQNGFALWMLVFILLLSGAYLAYRTGDAPHQRTRQAATLLRAKEALIARAVSDPNRPGSLPCPDLITDSQGLKNFPDDGKADMLAGNDCPSYLGWLPWITLDLPELADDSGSHLWYALSPTLRDDDSAQPINSDTAMTLEVDGSANIAALIIAPGAALGSQTRPSRNPADYLESTNGQSYKYVSGPAGTVFNDALLTISRAELMAAVEKRVAGEIRNCLEQHADAAANSAHRYPWPAPLAADAFQGRSGSRFGRIPETQPSSGPEIALQTSSSQLNEAQGQLQRSTDARQQLQALNTLNADVLQARNLFDVIFSMANKLKQTSDAAQHLLQAGAATITEATANGRISRSEGSAIRSLGENSMLLDTLPELLDQFGIDAFPPELARRSAKLLSADTPDKLLASTAAMRDLLASTYTPRSDIAPALAASTQAAASAYDAASAASGTNDSALLNTAKLTASQLANSTTALRNAIAASRINIRAGDVAEYPALLESLNSSLRLSPGLTPLKGLVVGLNGALAAVEKISTGTGGVISAKNAAREALAAAGAMAQSTQPDYTLIALSTDQAGEKMHSLVASIAANEAVDNNLAHTSLLAALANYRSANTRFANVDTTTPRPLQSDILPYAEAVGTTIAGMNFWLQLISTSASNNAIQAKAAPIDASEDATKVSILEDSAYAAASKTVTGIGGKKGALELLQAYIDTPDSETGEKAGQALAATTAQLDALLKTAATLAEGFSGTLASAQPMVWNSSRCDFLLPGQKTWWHSNQWAKTTFYQVGNILKSAPGTLTVNNAGSYRLITLASGQIINRQNRNLLTVANFLERANADPSRDGDAQHPVNGFTAGPPTADFNDRLAY